MPVIVGDDGISVSKFPLTQLQSIDRAEFHTGAAPYAEIFRRPSRRQVSRSKYRYKSDPRAEFAGENGVVDAYMAQAGIICGIIMSESNPGIID
jgi:hypothetical protein